MKARLVCYSLSKLTPAEKVSFRRSLYGFNDHSNNNKYSYRRQGLMNYIPHKKILDCVVIVRDSDAEKVVKTMKKHKANVHDFPVLAPFKV
jgi:hypothetical protein